MVTRFEFQDKAGEISQYEIDDLCSASDDSVANEVAMLAYRCAHGDLASDDPSHGRVTEYFSKIAYQLADNGAVPKA